MSNLPGLIFLAIFGFFWCGLTFTIDGVLIWQLAKQLRASNYPTVLGKVTHSEVKVDSSGDSDSYKPEVHYRYVVAGQTYESKDIRFDYMYSDRKQAEAVVQKYRFGQEVEVHYNPATPQSAVLELGIDLSNFFAALFLSPFNAIALGVAGGLWAMLRSRQLGRPIFGIALWADGLTTTIRVYERSPVLSALAAWGGAGFLATFGAMLCTSLMPTEYALGLGWSAVLAAVLVAWQYARKKYSEIRLDAMRGRLDIRDVDGRTYSLTREEVQPAGYTSRTTTDSEGARTTKYSMGLEYLDPESHVARMLTLPEQSSEKDAELFTRWLNDLLQLPHIGPAAGRSSSHWSTSS